MSNAVQELSNIYNDLVEKELTDICDEVFKRQIVPYFGHKYVYTEEFSDAGKDFIKEKELPIKLCFIDKYLSKKMQEEGLEPFSNSRLIKNKKQINLLMSQLFKEASSCVKPRNNNRTVFINCLKSFLNFLTIRRPSIFAEFEKLKYLLDSLRINPANQLEIFIETLKTNYSCLSDDYFYAFNPDYESLTKMMKHNFKYISKEQITDLVKNHKIESFLNNENSDLEDAQNELREYMHSHCEDVTELQKNCVKLMQLMNQESRTEEDNKTIEECMINLHFGELTSRLFSYLEHQREIKNAKTSSKKEKVKEEKKESDDNKKGSKKQPESPKKQTNLNQTIREINKYFDLDTCELKEKLSLDQVIYILSLMYLGNIEESKVETFLRSAMRVFKEFHPYAILHQAYDKFAYLSIENSEVKEHLDMIEYILSDASIFVCNDEEYKSTKELVSEELKEIMRIINGDYTYEVAEAKRLLNTNKE